MSAPESISEMIARITAEQARLPGPSVASAGDLMSQLTQGQPVTAPRTQQLALPLPLAASPLAASTPTVPVRAPAALTPAPAVPGQQGNVDELLSLLTASSATGQHGGSFHPILMTCRRTIPDLETEVAEAFTVGDLSKDQLAVYHPMVSWCTGAPFSLRTFAGFAGTGKTTVLGLLATEVTRTKQVAFCAYTGKAAGVLRRKLAQQGVQTSRFPERTGKRDLGAPVFPYCGTIHSLMYVPIEDEKTGRITGWTRQSNLPYGLIVVDEASMVTRKIFKDLSDYRVPILAVGDHGQLPPVADGKDDGDLGLMENPHWRLEQIHRQAAGSPIITLSKLVRENGGFPRGGGFDGKDKVQLMDMKGMKSKLEQLHATESVHDIAVLTYTNYMRQNVNFGTRRILGRDGMPVEGDQVVCLRNTDAVVFNGMRGIIISPVEEHQRYWYNATISFPDENLEVECSFLKGQVGRSETFKDWDEIQRDTGFRPRSKDQVGLLLDYGYALTVHKMQGSQAKHVFVVLERPSMVSNEHYARWLYTAVTRSSDYLYLVTV